MDFMGMSDEGILEEVARRVQRERLNQNITQRDLARQAGVSRTVIQSLEGGRGCTLAHLLRVMRALGVLGQLDAFLPDPGISPIQLARMQGSVRERASGSYGGRLYEYDSGYTEDGGD